MKRKTSSSKKSPKSLKSLSKQLLSITVEPSSGKRNKNTEAPLCEVVGFYYNGKSKTIELHPSYAHRKDVLSRLVGREEVEGRAGATNLLRFASDDTHLLLINVGSARTGRDTLPDTERVRRLGAQLVQKLSQEKISSARVYVDSLLIPAGGLSCGLQEATQALCEGAWMAAYQFKKYFSGSASAGPVWPQQLELSSQRHHEDLVVGLDIAKIIADCVYIARDLGNEPTNELHPSDFADDASAFAGIYGLKCHILDERALAKENMNLLLGVGRGAEHGPRLIQLEYRSKSPRAKHLALVGKGLCFDSGGISLKPGLKMEDMKFDMCGASAVIGATLAIARLKLPVHVTCIIAAAENMPDATAIQPGNVIKGRSGKTVEINNTDAEGRLVLADALDWAQDLKPDYLINAATLTGAVGIALGSVCAGLMGNDEELNERIQEAAARTFERVWELPMYSEYFDDLRSDFADMRNVGDNGAGGAIRGGIFLKQFIRDGQKWAHLDIASVAWGLGALPYHPRKSASGYGVRLLVETARILADQSA